MDILFIQKINVLGRPVVTAKNLHMVVLNFPGLFHNPLIGTGQALGEKTLPLRIGEGIAI